MKFESTGGNVDCTMIILPLFGLELIVILLSPSGKTVSSDLIYFALIFFDNFFAKSSDAFPLITVNVVNK